MGESIKKPFEYYHGYSDGFKEGFNKAFEVLKKQFEDIDNAKEIKIILEKQHKL